VGDSATLPRSTDADTAAAEWGATAAKGATVRIAASAVVATLPILPILPIAAGRQGPERAERAERLT